MCTKLDECDFNKTIWQTKMWTKKEEMEELLTIIG